MLNAKEPIQQTLIKIFPYDSVGDGFVCIKSMMLSTKTHHVTRISGVANIAETKSQAPRLGAIVIRMPVGVWLTLIRDDF